MEKHAYQQCKGVSSYTFHENSPTFTRITYYELHPDEFGLEIHFSSACSYEREPLEIVQRLSQNSEKHFDGLYEYSRQRTCLHCGICLWLECQSFAMGVNMTAASSCMQSSCVCTFSFLATVARSIGISRPECTYICGTSFVTATRHLRRRPMCADHAHKGKG
jgi:hypothetical protein